MSYPSCSDDQYLARVITVTWMLTSGKVLQDDIPPETLAKDELIDFWADEQMQIYKPRSLDAPEAESFPKAQGSASGGYGIATAEFTNATQDGNAAQAESDAGC